MSTAVTSPSPLSSTSSTASLNQLRSGSNSHCHRTRNANPNGYPSHCSQCPHLLQPTTMAITVSIAIPAAIPIRIAMIGVGAPMVIATDIHIHIPIAEIIVVPGVIVTLIPISRVSSVSIPRISYVPIPSISSVCILISGNGWGALATTLSLPDPKVSFLGLQAE
ncbi:hypothetical protein FN846DRAFT_894600 [Sphaerosporella brunnea]|uniref:Uncharacterized protein n=1 Tax=Sphaerosporella brunnea TaxID=1250544 RepID=A0A5J5EJS0_9PEZI|nr:hypothetical protein FN846DRAFT_894600 [Sphaerosporella brunnea]